MSDKKAVDAFVEREKRMKLRSNLRAMLNLIQNRAPLDTEVAQDRIKSLRQMLFELQE